jgi:hypothetical protein
VLVTHCVFENSYPAGQAGYADVVKTTNQSGGMTWAITQNVTYRQNVYLNVRGGVSIAGSPEANLTDSATNRIDYHQNVFVGNRRGGTVSSTSTPFFLASGAGAGRQLRDVRLCQNTAVGEFRTAVFFSGQDTGGLVIADNVLQYGTPDSGLVGFNGINGDGSQTPSSTNQGEPLFGDYTTTSISSGAPSSLTGNVLYAGYALTTTIVNAFPSNTLLSETSESGVIADWDAADPLSGNFALIHASTDGKGAPWERMADAIFNAFE